jgi:hypothetical protein
MAKSKWKPRREFKVVADRRTIKKTASTLADPTESPEEAIREFERDLKEVDIFSPKAGRRKSDVGGVEKLKHDGHILMMEWAIKFGELSPTQFLMERRGYSAQQAKDILMHSGGSKEWEMGRVKIQDKMSESVVKRHIDKMVEVNDQHIAASKLSMAKAIEMLTKLNVSVEVDPKTGKAMAKSMRSIDLVNITNAIEKAQTIYRRAMGIPNEESGIAQILEKVATMNVQQNVQINNTVVQNQAPKSDLQAKMEELDYDDILEFIEYRRELKKQAQDQANQPRQIASGDSDDKQSGS